TCDGQLVSDYRKEVQRHVEPRCAADHYQRPATSERRQAVPPSVRADVINDCSYLPGQRVVARKGLVSPERLGPAPTFFRTTRYPDLETRSPTELNQSGRHAPGCPLNQHRLAPLKSRFGEQGTVGGQPSRAEYRGVRQ